MYWENSLWGRRGEAAGSSENGKRTEIVQKSYLEGYKTPKMLYSLITKLYVRSKRKKSYIVRLRFALEQEEARK